MHIVDPKKYRAVLAVFVVLAMLSAPFLLSGCGDNSPEGATTKYLEALRSHDWEALKASISPESPKLNEDQEELAKQQFEHLKITGLDGIKMKTVYDKQDKNRARVTLTGGKVTYEVPVLGKKKRDTQDIAGMKEEEKPYFETVRVKGAWYVDKDLGDIQVFGP